MIVNLLNKELRLAAHPNLFVFTLLGILVIVPSYPYSMVFMFGCLGIFITFMYGRETNDVYYTALLPVKRNHLVLAKVILIVLIQMIQLLISLPFALIRANFLSFNNAAGIEANVAFYGIGLIIYAIFNFIFLTQFYKTAYKAGKAFLLACIPMILVMFLMEAIAHLSNYHWFDSIADNDLIKQLPFLIAGIIIYLIATISSYYLSIKHFKKVDL